MIPPMNLEGKKLPWECQIITLTFFVLNFVHTVCGLVPFLWYIVNKTA